MIDRARLHKFIEQRCDQIEAEGDWVKNSILTHMQEDKLKAFEGDTYGLSLAEGIAYEIGNCLLFHAGEFVKIGQLALDGSTPHKSQGRDVELVWDGKKSLRPIYMRR